MRNYFLFGLMLLTLNSGCAITHSYGPYMGKVVEKESGKPIEGAVVFMRFMTVGVFDTHNYGDAVEVLTNENGEFLIPAQRVNTFQVGGWEKDPSSIIFKPGYGAYPKYPGVEVDIWPWPVNQPVTIKLPKLKTREERKKNLSNLYTGSGVPFDKQKDIRKLRSIERVEVGLSPLSE